MTWIHIVKRRRLGKHPHVKRKKQRQRLNKNRHRFAHGHKRIAGSNRKKTTPSKAPSKRKVAGKKAPPKPKPTGHHKRSGYPSAKSKQTTHHGGRRK